HGAGACSTSHRASSNRRGDSLFPGSPDSCSSAAILDYREVAGHSIRPHVERIRLAGFAGGGDSGFKERIVELGMVRKKSGRPEGGGSFRHLLGRCDVAIVKLCSAVK